MANAESAGIGGNRRWHGSRLRVLRGRVQQMRLRLNVWVILRVGVLPQNTNSIRRRRRFRGCCRCLRRVPIAGGLGVHHLSSRWGVGLSAGRHRRSEQCKLARTVGVFCSLTQHSLCSRSAGSHLILKRNTTSREHRHLGHVECTVANGYCSYQCSYLLVATCTVDTVDGAIKLIAV